MRIGECSDARIAIRATGADQIGANHSAVTNIKMDLTLFMMPWEIINVARPNLDF